MYSVFKNDKKEEEEINEKQKFILLKFINLLSPSHNKTDLGIFMSEVCFIIITVLPIVLHLLYRPLFLRL